MKKFLLFLVVFLLVMTPYSFAENVTDGTGAGGAITTGVDNTAIGGYSLQSLTTGHGNTALGEYAGRSALTVNGGVYLGYGAGITNTSAHKLYINTMFYPSYGIFGDFSTGYFGINNTSPSVALDITGSMALSGTFSYALGTAAAPSIIFAGDTDTGLFGLASYGNRVGIAAKGATVAVADTAGVMMIPAASVRLSQYSNTADSSLTVSLSSGVPAVNFYGTDADTYSLTINTSDQAVFSGATAVVADTLNVTNSAATGYSIVNGAIIGRSGATIKGVVSADSVSIKPAAGAANVLLRGRNSTGINVATIDTTGATLIGMPYDGNISFIAVNNDSTGTSTTANVKATAQWGSISAIAHGKGRTSSRYGHQIGNWGTLEMDATSTYTGANGMIIGTRCAKPIVFGINDSFAAVIDSTEKFGIGTELPTAKLTVRGVVGDNDSLIVARSSTGNTVAFLDSLGHQTLTGGLALTGSTAKTVNFAGMTPNMTDPDNALLAFGTWNDEVDIGTQTAHFVPFQVHMHSTTSAPYDIAAMRLRVDTDGDNSQNAVQVLQIRSSISDSVASAGAFGAGMSIDAPMTVKTGEMVVGGFSMAGAYKPTSATNPVTILQACNWNTYAGTSVTQIADFYQNGAGNTVDDILRLNVIAGTATDGLHVSNTSGTMTNGIKLSGTIGTDITLQNSETIKNTQNGKIDFGGIVRMTGINSSDSLIISKASDGTVVAILDSLGHFKPKRVTADTLNTTNLAATGYGIVNGAFIGRGGSTITGSASADTTKGTNAAFTGYGIINGAFIGRSGATITGNGSFTGYVSQFYNVQAITADSTLTSTAMPSGSIITNGAAGGAIEVTLPTAVVGLTYKFVTTDTDSLIIVAGASDTITDNTGVSKADYAAVGTVGETVELVAISDAIWQVMNKIGTWESR